MLAEPAAFARVLERSVYAVGKLTGREPSPELLAAIGAVREMGAECKP
jgi:hypothetical protein